jgi:FAD/FMN-containing dehydrogenase
MGDGNVHVNYVVRPDTGQDVHTKLLDRLYDQVDALGGSISAEHGVGRVKRDAVMKRRRPLCRMCLGA